MVAGGFDQELKVIDLEKYNEKIEAKEAKGQITSICKLGKNSFTTGVDDGTLRLWNCSEWTISKETRMHKRPISHIAADPS